MSVRRRTPDYVTGVDSLGLQKSIIGRQHSSPHKPSFNRNRLGPFRMPHQPIVRKPGEGRAVAVVGDVYRFLATGAETAGKYATSEAFRCRRGRTATACTQPREEETFYVLSGEITFQIAGERVVATAGMFANMPVGGCRTRSRTRAVSQRNSDLGRAGRTRANVF